MIRKCTNSHMRSNVTDYWPRNRSLAIGNSQNFDGFRVCDRLMSICHTWSGNIWQEIVVFTQSSHFPFFNSIGAARVDTLLTHTIQFSYSPDDGHMVSTNVREEMNRFLCYIHSFNWCSSSKNKNHRKKYKFNVCEQFQTISSLFSIEHKLLSVRNKRVNNYPVYHAASNAIL